MKLKALFLAMLTRATTVVKEPVPVVQLRPLAEYPTTGADISTLRMLTQMNPDHVSKTYEMHQDHPWLRLLIRRLTDHDMKGRVDLRIYLYILNDLDRPAIAILWAYELYRMIERFGPNLSLGDFLTEFYRGLPQPGSYEQAWYAQKAGSVNLLDTQEQWA